MEHSNMCVSAWEKNQSRVMKIDRSFFIDKKMWKTSEALTLRRRKLSVVKFASFILSSEGEVIASKRRAVASAPRWSIWRTAWRNKKKHPATRSVVQWVWREVKDVTQEQQLRGLSATKGRIRGGTLEDCEPRCAMETYILRFFCVVVY